MVLTCNNQHLYPLHQQKMQRRKEMMKKIAHYDPNANAPAPIIGKNLLMAQVDPEHTQDINENDQTIFQKPKASKILQTNRSSSNPNNVMKQQQIKSIDRSISIPSNSKKSHLQFKMLEKLKKNEEVKEQFDIQMEEDFKLEHKYEFRRVGILKNINNNQNNYDQEEDYDQDIDFKRYNKQSLIQPKKQQVRLDLKVVNLDGNKKVAFDDNSTNMQLSTYQNIVSDNNEENQNEQIVRPGSAGEQLMNCQDDENVSDAHQQNQQEEVQEEEFEQIQQENLGEQ